jgi:hypothetical protein
VAGAAEEAGGAVGASPGFSTVTVVWSFAGLSFDAPQPAAQRAAIAHKRRASLFIFSRIPQHALRKVER